MATREELRALGKGVMRALQHGTKPPRPRPLHQASVPGLADLTTEALWGSVWARPGLSMHDRMLATLAALSALQRLPQLRTYLNSAINIGVTTLEITETLIQVSLTAGFPTTVNATELLRDVIEKRDEQHPEPPPIADAAAEDLDARGRELYARLFGAAAANVGLSPAALALQGVEMAYAWGQAWVRPGLDLRTRALVTTASLTALRDETELRRWLPAACRAGLSGEEIDETILQCAYYAGFPAARRALELAAEAARA